MKYSYLFVIMFLAQGCLLKRIVVSNADHAIELQIEKRLPLYSLQKDELSKDIDLLLNQSKPKIKEIVPVLRDLKMESVLIEDQYTRLKNIYIPLSQDFVQIYSKYVSKLDPKQQKKFFKQYDETTSEIKEKTKKEKLKTLRNRFEMFFNSISAEQETLLRNLNQDMMNLSKSRIEGRLYIKEELIKIFANLESLDGKLESIKTLYNNYHLQSIHDQKNIQLLKLVAVSLSKEQQAFFQKKTKEIEDLVEFFLTKSF